MHTVYNICRDDGTNRYYIVTNHAYVAACNLTGLNTLWLWDKATYRWNSFTSAEFCIRLKNMNVPEYMITKFLNIAESINA